MTENSGLKVGLGATALSAASVYTTPKIVGKVTKFGIKAVRNGIKEADEIINTGRNTMKVTTGNLYDMAKARYDLGVSQKDALYKQASALFNNRKLVKNTNLLKPLMLTMPLYLGLGAIIDFANKKQRAKSAPNATTKNGNDYTKVNMGKKLGAAFGVAAYAVNTIVNKNIIKKILATSPNKVVTLTVPVVSSVIGGLTMGAIVDKISNNKAAKMADKAAM